MAIELPTTLDSLEIVSAAGSQRLPRFSEGATFIKAGGVGAVFSHARVPGKALKFFRDLAIADGHAAKVQAMVLNPPGAVLTPDGIVQVVWPDAIILDHGRFVGFTMPLVNFQQAWTMQQVVQPQLRRQYRIPERLELRLYAALNLATVMQSLHDAGHYAIDLKPPNVLVYRSQGHAGAGYVALIDCDGYQVRGPDGRRHDAGYTTLSYLNPDVAAKVDGRITFDPQRLNDKAVQQDKFALAVVLFQLLNCGLHPMSGRVIDAARVPTEESTRLLGRGKFYAYGRHSANPLIAPDPDSLHGWFDPQLRDLFDQAFAGDPRPPTPRAWADVFKPLAHARHRCAQSPAHWKLGPSCGQCAQSAQSTPPLTSRPVRVVNLPVGKNVTSAAGMAILPRFTVNHWAVPWLAGAIVVACVGLLSEYGVALRSPPSPTYSAPRPGRAELLQSEAKTLAFAEKYFSVASSYGERAMAFYQQVYPPRLDYYDRQLTAGAALADKKRFIELWPQRFYRLQTSSAKVSCGAATCRFTGLVDWDERNIWRHERRSGVAEYILDISFVNGTPLILMESSRIVSQAS